jgi:hypothetical protein
MLLKTIESPDATVSPAEQKDSSFRLLKLLKNAPTTKDMEPP